MLTQTKVGFLIETSYIKSLRSELQEFDTTEVAKLAFTLLDRLSA